MISSINQPIKYLLFLFLLLSVDPVIADVPVRVSIKFIVDADGNRSATGAYNSDADILFEMNTSDEVFAGMDSEVRFQVTEIIDLPASLSSHFDFRTADRDEIRNLATASPTTWSWRTNAINVYISGVTDPAACGVSAFPPNNNIVLLMQDNLPGCLTHEKGHSLDLAHTHASNDGCSDTITDNQDWTSKDQMANANYSSNYSLLTAAQQDAVDRTWHNVMSYHFNPPWDRITLCQKDRISAQVYNDRNWLLTKIPVYVKSTSLCGVSCNGSWLLPYPNLQSALSAGSLTGKAIVLEKGNYTITQVSGVNADVDIGTRNGVSKVDRGRPVPFELPGDLVNSKNSAVSAAVRAAQSEATMARKVFNEAKKNAAAAKEVNRAAILEKAKAKKQAHEAKVLGHFLNAEKQSSGNERLVIQLELAKMYRNSKNYSQCVNYYNRVAENTDQPALKEITLWQAGQCQKKIADTNEEVVEVEE